MTIDILTREDTGTHAVVRVVDPDQPVSAPYSRAVGILDKWVRDERRAVDEFAAWIEGQAAQAAAEMRQLCDELGLPPAPVAWAELPDDGIYDWDPVFQYPSLNQAEPEPLSLALRGRYGTIGEPSPYDPDPPAGRPVRYDVDRVQAYYDADDSDERPGRRVRLTPRDNPLAQAYAEREARGWTPDPADYEDHGPIDRWLQRADTRLRRTRFGRWLAARFTPVKED